MPQGLPAGAPPCATAPPHGFPWTGAALEGALGAAAGPASEAAGVGGGVVLSDFDLPPQAATAKANTTPANKPIVFFIVSPFTGRH